MGIVEPYYPKVKTDRLPFGIETFLRIHCLQQQFAPSDPAMEMALHDMPVSREYAGLEDGLSRIPGALSGSKFRRLRQWLMT